MRGVVKIAGKNFNIDMDNYIKDRRSKEYSKDSKTIGERFSDFKDDVYEWKVFSLFKRRSGDRYVDDFEEDDEDYIEEETEIEAIDELEDELEERREGVLRRFFKKLRLAGRRRPVEEDFDEDEVLEEDDGADLDDIREVIKITHSWLEELPPETLNRFKRSEDFVKYKEVLKKLKMIK